MMGLGHLVFAILLVGSVGCGEKKAAPEKTAPDEATPDKVPERADEPESTCKAQATELKEFLTALFDEEATVKAPWPTGDAELDERIEQARESARKAMAPPAGSKQPTLSPGVNTKPDEEMYRECPQGLAALQAVATAAPDKRSEAFIKIADAVEECDCKVNMPWLKAAYYLMQRGPD